MLYRLCLLIAFLCVATCMNARDSTLEKISQVPSQYLDKLTDRAADLGQKLDKKSEKALQQLAKEEAKMKSKLQKIDSLAAKKIFADAEMKYQELGQRLKNSTAKQYIPRLDTLATSLKFLKDNPQFISQAKEVKEKLETAINKVKGLENQFQRAEEIKKFLKERKQFLKDQLSRFGFTKELKKLNKQLYYFAQQVNEYKEILKDPKKIEKKAIELLTKTKLFKDFMRKNSMLASLFRLPGDPNDPSSNASLAGLQTRAQVNNLIQQQIASGGPNAQQQFQQNMQAAQAQMNELKNKLMQFGGSSSNDELPDFKPNTQKTKSFLKRLEWGANIQSQKATNFFPVTSDIGLSMGYKLNDKSVIGIGASYKLGWGRGWNNIAITHQGLGLRSYVDIKLKGSIWISGGYEQNYKPDLQNIAIPPPFGGSRMGAAWQHSGLIGLSKTVPIKTKFFKKTSIKLLWDFLSYQQVPRTQPVVFRIGYNF